MIKVLFVCHCNICRSPMAEFIFLRRAAEAGLSGRFEAASAATSREELGNDMYPPAKAVLRAHGIPFSRRAARQVTLDDMRNYDYIVIMDDYNARNLRRMYGFSYDEKIFKLLSFAGEDRDVSDPWYTDDFDTAYREIDRGCAALLAKLTANS